MPRRAKPKLQVGDKVRLANGDRFKVTNIERVEMVSLENKEKKARRQNQFVQDEKGKWVWQSKPRGRRKAE